jgi:hypothetical protein
MITATQNTPSTISFLTKQSGFVFNVCFWLYFLKKDSCRYADKNNFSKKLDELSVQRKIAIAGKVVGDCLRLVDVIGRKFPHAFNQQAIKAARITGLFLGAVDGWNEQIFSFKKIQKKTSISSCCDYLSHVYFNAFSLSSILSINKKLESNARPAVLLGCMAGSIIISIAAQIFTKKTN